MGYVGAWISAKRHLAVLDSRI
jgi:hypothetical protein